MEEYEKENETDEEYERNRVERIKKLCKLADVDYGKYIEALEFSQMDYTIILQRDIDEIFTNNYNEEWLRAWDANMDIQVTLNFWAVFTYVFDYWMKVEKGKMKAIEEALRKSSNEKLREKMMSVANAFITHRQVGEAEAVYRLIPSMHLVDSNLKCVWVSLGKEETRVRAWKKVTDEEIKKFPNR